MTNREFLVSMKSVILCDEKDITFSADELLAKADEMIASLDHKNELRKSTESKEKKESLARRMAIVEFFSANPTLSLNRDEIAENLGMTVGQATSACTMLVKENYLTKSEVKVDKSRKMVYSLATN